MRFRSGVLIEGESYIDSSALTGESEPRKISQGESLLSGCVNQTNVIKLKVNKLFGESTVSKIIEMVENASEKKAKTENFITRFAKYYTPFVVLFAIMIAIIPPVILQVDFAPWIERALIFLVISCPCALVISVPLSFFGGIGGASRVGVLINCSYYLEVLSTIKTMVFDITGSLTKGKFCVVGIQPVDCTEAELIQMAATAEIFSTHPIALSLQDAYYNQTDNKIEKPTHVEEVSGHGLIASCPMGEIYIGNRKLMEQFKIDLSVLQDENEVVGSVVYVAQNLQFKGRIIIADQIKDEAVESLKALRNTGVEQLVMLTGDIDVVGKSVAKQLELDQAYTELLPGDKVTELERLITNNNGKVAFVGDGINEIGRAHV